jgi:Aspartyl protease
LANKPAWSDDVKPSLVAVSVALLFSSVCLAYPQVAVRLSTSSGIRLFTSPDESSAVVANLTDGDDISPLADTLVGQGIRWYLVKTKNGTIGWMKQSDNEQSRKLEKFFRALPAELSLPSAIDAPSSPSGASVPNTIKVPVEMNGSWVIVPAIFNGSLKAYLQLDTGASSTLVSRRIANRLTLSALGSRKGVTVGGPITVSVARLGSLNVGGAEVRDLIVSIHDFSPDPRVEGLLGLDFLRHFHVSLDTRQKLLILGPR